MGLCTWIERVTVNDLGFESTLFAELNAHNAPRFGHGPHRTVVVLGAEPLATARIVRVLTELGVFMGHSLTPDGQDWAFCVPTPGSLLAACTAPGRLCVTHIRETAGRRNRDHQHWGLNVQLDLAKLAWLAGRIRAPYCILPTISVAPLASEELTVTALDDRVLFLAESHLDLCRFVKGNGLPGVVFDMARAELHPRRFVTGLAALLGIEVTASRLSAARAVLESPANTQGFSQLFGYVDTVSDTDVSGWAVDPTFPTRPLELRLLVDGRCIAYTVANQPRPDVGAARMHPTGECGFVFSIPRGAVALGQEVRVVDWRGRDLNKSGVLHRPGVLRLLRYPRQSSTISGSAWKQARHWAQAAQLLLGRVLP